MYHLQGGIHAYQTAYGDSGHFQGKNFVFDPRGSVSNSEAFSYRTIRTTTDPASSDPADPTAVPIATTALATGGADSLPPSIDPVEYGINSIDSNTKHADEVVGQCCICQCKYDDYTSQTRCSLCRMLVLVCPECIQPEVSIVCELCEKRR